MEDFGGLLSHHSSVSHSPMGVESCASISTSVNRGATGSTDADVQSTASQLVLEEPSTRAHASSQRLCQGGGEASCSDAAADAGEDREEDRTRKGHGENFGGDVDRDENGRVHHCDKKRRSDTLTVESLFDFDSFRKVSKFTGQSSAKTPAAQPSANNRVNEGIFPTPVDKFMLSAASQRHKMGAVGGTDTNPLRGNSPREDLEMDGICCTNSDNSIAEASRNCQTSASNVSSSLPLREIAVSGLNLHPLRANRFLGIPTGSRFVEKGSLTSALFDDDTDQLDLD